jgi:hypothetical protein
MVTLSNARGAFAAGQRVLLHQTQAATGPVGQYEYARVAAVGVGTLTLAAPAGAAYVTDATRRAQIVVVAEVGALTVPAGATLTAPAWDGNVGGVLAIDASGAAAVAGAITMTGRGFRGRGHTGIYRCARGFQGEGQLALGGVNIAANGSGGGGGGAGQDDGAGGGGAYGATGAAGGNGLCGACAEACPIPGGAGGAAVGSSNLATSLFLGGAGGEGGADEDGCHAGAGGTGGGIVLVRASALTVTGAITSGGATGVGGDSSCAGCGMGGGGGGAGGAVRLLSIGPMMLGVNQVRATGGLGGGATCGSTSGGSGSVGRVGVRAATIAGSTLPLYSRN